MHRDHCATVVKRVEDHLLPGRAGVNLHMIYEHPQARLNAAHLFDEYPDGGFVGPCVAHERVVVEWLGRSTKDRAMMLRQPLEQPGHFLCLVTGLLDDV